MINKHTPTPWKIVHGEYPCEGMIEIDTATDRVAKVFCDDSTDYVGLGNAEFIVRACNSYYDLVSALEKISIIRQDSGSVSTRDLVSECVSISKNALGKV